MSRGETAGRGPAPAHRLRDNVGQRIRPVNAKWTLLRGIDEGLCPASQDAVMKLTFQAWRSARSFDVHQFALTQIPQYLAPVAVL